MAGIAIQKDKTILGYKLDEIEQEQTEQKDEISVEEFLSDGTRVINSASLAEDIIGYAGRTPIKLHVKSDVIQKVEVLPNAETPGFWAIVVKSGILEKWQGMSLNEASSAQMDAISGATFSKVALVGNVQRAAQYAASVEAKPTNTFPELGFKTIAGLLVILLGVIITIAKFRQKWLITLQLVLNVAVLGFWCGSFLSLSSFVAWISNGVNLSMSLIVFAMFIIAIVMPLFNRKGSYCHIHCPMGSAQELLAKLPLKKMKIKPAIASFLNKLRYYIILALLFIMWLGVGFEYMEYEVFSAFMYNSASTAVLVMATIVLILSPFIVRPYCRFICPTGALLTMSQKTKE